MLLLLSVFLSIQVQVKMSQKGKPKPAANNTLFKYFQKSPAQSSPNSSLIKTPNPPANTTPKVEKKSANAAKNESRFGKE